MNLFPRLLALIFPLSLGGCATLDRWAYPTVPVEVEESGRSQQCGGTEMIPQVTYLSHRDAVTAWQTQRGIQLKLQGELTEAPYALVEMGQFGTGGYGLAVSRAGSLYKNWLTLRATFVVPGEDAIVTEAITSPCVLVRLPAGDWMGVRVVDQAGTLRASTTTVQTR